MRFKIIVADKEAEIEESEIETAIKLIGAGGIVVLKHIVFNSAYFQAIVPDYELARDDAERKTFRMRKQERPSEFAKILAPKLRMLSPENTKGNQAEGVR